jgi:hypothetical protein
MSTLRIYRTLHTLGTPIKVTVKFLTNGGFCTNCTRNLAVATKPSTMAYIGIGSLNQSHAPTKNSSIK